ncbi:head-tail adaptor protein [Pseudomonas sp. BGM005]|nr:head-tail adaptor protein [Pseudomonas sp. BG5]
MKRPAAGERNKRISIRRRNDKSKGDSELESEYTLVGRRWAKIEPLGTLLVNSGITIGDKITHRISFPVLRGIDQRCEVVCGSRLFRVSGVGDIAEAGIDTVLEVEEITGNPQSAGTLPSNDPYEDDV